MKINEKNNCEILIVYTKQSNKNFIENRIKSLIESIGAIAKLELSSEIPNTEIDVAKNYTDVLNCDLLIIDLNAKPELIINYIKASHFLERETIFLMPENVKFDDFYKTKGILIIPYLINNENNLFQYGDMKATFKDKQFPERNKFLSQIEYNIDNLNESVFKIQQLLLTIMHTNVLIQIVEYDKENTFIYNYELDRQIANHLHSFNITMQVSNKVHNILENAREVLNSEILFKLEGKLENIDDDKREWLLVKTVKLNGKEKKDYYTYKYSYPLY